jgi:hypothetical protein
MWIQHQTNCGTYCNQLHIIDGFTQAVPEGIEHISSPTVVRIYHRSVISNGEKSKVITDKIIETSETYFPVVCISIASTLLLFNNSAVIVGSRT